MKVNTYLQLVGGTIGVILGFAITAAWMYPQPIVVATLVLASVGWIVLFIGALRVDSTR